MSATCRVLWKPTKWVQSCNIKSVEGSIARPKAYTKAPTDVIVKSNLEACTDNDVSTITLPSERSIARAARALDSQRV